MDGAQSARSNGTHTQGMFWSPDKTTEASNPSRSGMTFKPSTDGHGAAVLKWCLEDSRARTSVSPTHQEKESPETSLGCGWKWPESSVKFDPASRSWKTRQLSLLGDLEPFSETWPEWGMMRDGECWALSMPELPTPADESGLWRSPAASEAGVSVERLETRNGQPVGSNCRHYDIHTGRLAQIGLTQQVKARELFRTPNASNGAKWSNQSREEREAKGQQVRLCHQLGAGGSLNPEWVEWLMGWPIGHTDCDASATDRFQQWFDSHGKF